MPDITVSLTHVEPSSKRRTKFLRARAAADPEHNPGRAVSLQTVVRDGRGNADLTLDAASFELVQHPTRLITSDFYDAPEKVVTDYYDEMRELFERATGARHVHIFHHQLRNLEATDMKPAEDGSIDTGTRVQPYARDDVHTDSSNTHAEELWTRLVGSMPVECRAGRFVYINAWRNISEAPIESDHLAVLDERSLVRPDDYVPTDLFAVGYDVLQYGLSARNAARHRWYHFPRMVKDEVLLIKQWDSDPTAAGRVCFHTAVVDPTAPDGTPCRQSIEVSAPLIHSPRPTGSSA